MSATDGADSPVRTVSSGEQLVPTFRVGAMVNWDRGSAVSGGALGASLGTSHRRLCALISLGAGTLLGVTTLAILSECLEAVQWWGVLLALGWGDAIFALVIRYVYHVFPACAAGEAIRLA